MQAWQVGGDTYLGWQKTVLAGIIKDADLIELFGFDARNDQEKSSHLQRNFIGFIRTTARIRLQTLA